MQVKAVQEDLAPGRVTSGPSHQGGDCSPNSNANSSGSSPVPRDYWTQVVLNREAGQCAVLSPDGLSPWTQVVLTREARQCAAGQGSVPSAPQVPAPWLPGALMGVLLP